jgi:sporulation protein YlmC with PRC-barrel domain
MRLSDLRDKKIKTADGKTLGRVHEVHCDGGKIVALACGAVSYIERLTAKDHGRRIPWENVLKVDEDAVVVTTDPPKRKASGSRSRQRTPRPSGRRSKR